MQHKGLTLQWTFWKMFFWSWSYPPLDFGRLLESYLTFNMFAELVFPRELKCWLLLSRGVGGRRWSDVRCHSPPTPFNCAREENCKYFQLFPPRRVSLGLVARLSGQTGFWWGAWAVRGWEGEFMGLGSDSSTPSSQPQLSSTQWQKKRKRKNWELGMEMGWDSSMKNDEIL